MLSGFELYPRWVPLTCLLIHNGLPTIILEVTIFCLPFEGNETILLLIPVTVLLIQDLLLILRSSKTLYITHDQPKR